MIFILYLQVYRWYLMILYLFTCMTYSINILVVMMLISHTFLLYIVLLMSACKCEWVRACMWTSESVSEWVCVSVHASESASVSACECEWVRKCVWVHVSACERERGNACKCMWVRVRGRVRMHVSACVSEGVVSCGNTNAIPPVHNTDSREKESPSNTQPMYPPQKKIPLTQSPW